MPLADFYRTMSELCFTLLGLWWVVVQTSHQRWIADPGRRRTVVNISLYFLLPGSMSLLAVLASEQLILWRIAFATASAFGVVETLVLLQRMERPARRWPVTLPRLLALTLYALVVLVAIIPDASRAFAIAPLTTAGTLLSLLVILGAGLALAYFVEPPSG